MLSSRLPYPLVGGDRIRVYNTAKILATEYEVDLLAINETSPTSEETEALEGIFRELILFDLGPRSLRINALKKLLSRKPVQVGGYYFPAIQRWIDKHCKQYDLVYCNHIRTTEYARSVPCRKVVDLVDAISMNYKTALERATGFWKAFYFVEDRRLLPYELKVLRSFSKCFITSPVDRDYLLGHASGNPHLEVIPNGVNSRALQGDKPVDEKSWITFLGKMDYYPNEDAAIHFAKEVFPLLRETDNDLKFVIVGAYPTRRVRQLKGITGVEVTGYVDEPYEYLVESKVVVAPMRFGAGIQNKVLEAMAAKKAIVTTSRAAGGIDGKDGQHFVIADTPRMMSQQILELLQNGERRKALGENARSLIREKYTWEVVGEALLRQIGELMR